MYCHFNTLQSLAILWSENSMMHKLMILTLYLSTMGNLTGPSLDLYKIGKLSRCGMNGNPLKSKYKIIDMRLVNLLNMANIKWEISIAQIQTGQTVLH